VALSDAKEAIMGALDDMLGKAVPGGSITKPLMIALGALLVGKMLTGRSSEPKAAEPQSKPAAPEDEGITGGLGGLLEKLRTAGHADTANSWVGPGQNAPIEPGQLGSALGQQTISAIAKQAGVSEQELLAQLSKVLPGVVDKLTPNGRMPTRNEIAALFQS
jgi:uncharacterized protein YidB (DUF937 family)